MSVDKTTIVVDGLETTRSLLKDLDATALKQVDKEVTAVARDLKGAAAASFSRMYSGADAAYTIRTRNRRDSYSKSVTTTGGTVARGERWSSQPGVLAAVMEFAANVRTANPATQARTRKMLDTVTARYGSPGRFLWDAWDAMRPDLETRVTRYVEQMEASLQRALDRTGD